MRRSWSDRELLLALQLYISAPKCSRADPALETLAEKIGRSTGSVYARLQNFKSVDPNYEGVGLSAGKTVCERIWDTYSDRLKKGESLDTLLSELSMSEQVTWLELVRNLISNNWQEGQIFSLSDLYEFESEFASHFPGNSFVKDKLRQVLQQLREEEVIEFLDQDGRYRRIPISEACIFPDEIVGSKILLEGSVKMVTVNAYERSAQARVECLRYHGSICAVCEISFEDMYGEIGRGFIHVHHLKPLSSIAGIYNIDPVRDLVPVCPNCHAMLHRRNPPFSIEELRKKVDAASHQKSLG